MTLQQIDSLQRLPLQPVDTRGLVQLLYGSQDSKYPAWKMVVAGAVDESGGYTSMLVKFSAVPPCMNQIRVDSIVRIRGAEVKNAWRRTDGMIQESALHSHLSSNELSSNVSKKWKSGSARMWLGDGELGSLWVG